MGAVPFDTLALARKLEAAGFDRRFDQIDGKLAALEAQITMVKWISGATFAGVLALILRTFRPT